GLVPLFAVLYRVRRKGSSLPVSHLVVRRTRGSSDSRLGTPRRRTAEDGHLRITSIQCHALPCSGPRTRALDQCSGTDWNCVRCACSVGATEHEVASGILLGQPPWLLCSWNLHLHSNWS